MATYTDNGTNTPNGSHKVFTYTFPAIQTEDIKVALNGIVQATTKYTASLSPAQIEFNNNSIDSSVQESTGAPKTGVQVRVFRETTVGKNNGDEDPKAVFAAGSSIRAADLNANTEQALFAIHELQTQPIKTSDVEDGAITSAKIKDLTIVDGDISATAEIEVYKLKDGAANQVLVTQNDGTTVNWSSNIDLPGTLDVAGNVDFDGNLDVDGTTNLDNTNVVGDLYVSGTALVDNVLIDGSTIETASGDFTLKAFGSNNVIVDDPLAVTGTLNVTQGVTLQNPTCTVNGSQVVTETASQTLTNKTLTTPVINDMSGTAVVTSGTSTSDNKIYSAKRSDELYYRKGTADDIEESGVPWSGNDSTIATTAAIDARIVDILDDVGGFVPLLNETKIPQLHPEYVNKDTADRVGTILSIGTLTTTYTPSGGTVTIQASDLTNHSVNATITDCGSTVLASGFGVLVETKAQTDSQYADGPSFKFHRLVPKATEVTTVAGKATEITTVHTNINNVNTVATNISDINAVAADQADIGAVAAKATEIGRLGTADAVADMAILGTADVVADLNTLGTADVVADMNMLATSDVVADMNMLAVSDVISDMDDLATSGNITAMSTCSTNIASINNCSTNISSVNNFGDQYQVASSNPSTDGGGNALAEGDLYFNTTANELKVYNGGAWQGGVTASGNFASTTGNTFTGDNRYNDNAKALFGTGSDLEIYHNGNHSKIVDTGTGNLYLESDVGNIYLRVSDNEQGVTIKQDGAVELYYDNSKKLETTSTGVSVTGGLTASGSSTFNDDVTFIGDTTHLTWDRSNRTLQAQDNAKIKFGTSGDLEIYHDGSNSYINDTGTGALNVRGSTVRLRKNDSTENMISCASDGTVELYYDNSKKFETTSYGAAITSSGSSHGLKVFHSNGNEVASLTHGGSGDEGVLVLKDSAATTVVIRGENGTDADITTGGNFDLEHDSAKLRLGADNDLQIYHNGSHSFIDESGTGNLYIRNGTKNSIWCQTDGAVKLYHNDSAKVETTSQGVNLEGNGSDHYILDLHNTGSGKGSQIQFRNDHDASANIGIAGDTTGDLRLYTEKTFKVQHGADVGIKSINNGAVELYHNGTKKLETASDKINFYAHAKVNADATYDLGASGARWNDLYIANDIDIKDDGKLLLGDSDDLQIYHDGTDSKIQNTTDSALKIINGGNAGMLIQNQNSYNIEIKTNAEDAIKCIANGAVELYHNNTKTFETTSEGATFDTGSSSCVVRLTSNTDAVTVLQGFNSDFTIKAPSGGSVITQVNSNEDAIKALANGAVELYYDNVVKLQTRANDVWIRDDLILADSDKIKLGDSADFQMYHATNSYIDNSMGSLYIRNTSPDVNSGDIYIQPNNTEHSIWAKNNGAVELYYNGSKKFETTSTGALIEDELKVGVNDNAVATVEVRYSTVPTYLTSTFDGTFGEATLSVNASRTSSGSGSWGSASNSGYGIGALQVLSHSSTGSQVVFLTANADNTAPSKRVMVTGDGHLIPYLNNTYDLGDSSTRWRNIYTNDLNLSNEGGSNDVDGTWGDWTIQEGESDLFLKNNRSGKKYKFNLTEVS